MNVLLIQPPQPPAAVRSRSSLEAQRPEGVAERPAFSPPWSLLCLNAYLQQRTRHAPFLIDARFFSNLETDIAEYVRQLPEAQVAVVEATTTGLGQVMQILDVLKRSFPRLVTALCGQHASQFPAQALTLPRVDFVLAGDPEPILHSLLDNFDTPTRLKRTPGLLYGDSESQTASWLNDLNSLSLPEGHGFFWSAYAGRPGSGGCRLEVRLTRGHTRCPADRAFGGAGIPLRAWRPERLAGFIQKTSDTGVSHFLLTDPPGVWTPERLAEWCRMLVRQRNSIPWSMQLLPTHLSEPAVHSMAQAQCRTVGFIFPSCEPDVLKKYGCLLGPGDLDDTFALLREYGIRPQSEFWAGGPEEPAGEHRRLARALRHLKFKDFSLELFPCRPDAPLYRELRGQGAPKLEDWIRWACDPWNHERPLAVWGGPDQVAVWDQQFQRLLRGAQRSMFRRFADLLQRTRAALAQRNPWAPPAPHPTTPPPPPGPS